MDNYQRIEELILEMGDFACTTQRDIVRNYKDDGTVLTKTDLFISERMTSLITELFPEANIITEEALHIYKKDAPITFILDPIDGTDVYSQGLPCWCISLGILGPDLRCIGGMVNAPRWGLCRDEGLLLRLDPDKTLLLNGRPFQGHPPTTEVEQITMASNAPKYIKLQSYDGKVRCYGSNILHMLSPLIHSNIQGSISVPCYAWDVAGAHALLESQGIVVEYADGKPFLYNENLLKQRKPFEGLLVSGSRMAVEKIRTFLA
jgi:myo-inositol-1(or 4)-monophosphatase